jgi:hypothetical protein
MSNDSAVLAVPFLERQYGTLIRIFREVGAHRDPKELLAALANELPRVLP